MATEREIASALRAQRRTVVRTRAQSHAKTELSKRHPREYRQLYDEAKKRLEAEDGE